MYAYACIENSLSHVISGLAMGVAVVGPNNSEAVEQNNMFFQLLVELKLQLFIYFCYLGKNIFGIEICFAECECGQLLESPYPHPALGHDPMPACLEARPKEWPEACSGVSPPCMLPQ